jgi:hypothetical protein
MKMLRKFSLVVICLLFPLLAGFGWQPDEGKEPESSEALALWRARLEEAVRPESPYHSYMSQGWLRDAARRLSPQDAATAAELTVASMKRSANNVEDLALLTTWLFALEGRVPPKVAEGALSLLWEKFSGASGDDRTILALRVLRIGNSPLAKDSCGFSPEKAAEIFRVLDPSTLFNLKDGNLEVGLAGFEQSRTCLTPEQVSRYAAAMQARIQKDPASRDRVKPYLDSLGLSGN